MQRLVARATQYICTLSARPFFGISAWLSLPMLMLGSIERRSKDLFTSRVPPRACIRMHRYSERCERAV